MERKRERFFVCTIAYIYIFSTVYSKDEKHTRITIMNYRALEQFQINRKAPQKKNNKNTHLKKVITDYVCVHFLDYLW